MSNLSAGGSPNPQKIKKNMLGGGGVFCRNIKTREKRQAMRSSPEKGSAFLTEGGEEVNRGYTIHRGRPSSCLYLQVEEAPETAL